MSYVEKMVAEIGINVANHHCNKQMAALIVEKIIADMKAGCLESIRSFGNFASMHHSAYVEAIEQAEAKEANK